MSTRRRSQFPVLSSTIRTTRQQTQENGTVSSASTVFSSRERLPSSGSSSAASQSLRSVSPDTSGGSVATVYRINQGSLVGNGRRDVRAQNKNQTLTTTLPSIVKAPAVVLQTRKSDPGNVTNKDLNSSDESSLKREKERTHKREYHKSSERDQISPTLRCQHCGSSYHTTADHYSGNVLKKEFKRRNRRRRRRKGNVPEKDGENRNAKRLHDKTKRETNKKDTTSPNSKSETDFVGESGNANNSADLFLPERTKDDATEHQTKNGNEKFGKDGANKIAPWEDSGAERKEKESALGRENSRTENKSRNPAKRKVLNEERVQGVSDTNNNKKLQKSKSVLHERVKRDQGAGDRLLNRSTTVHGLFEISSKPLSRVQKNGRAHSGLKDGGVILPNSGINAYRSIATIPKARKTSQTSNPKYAATESKPVDAYSSKLQENRALKSSPPLLSINDLSKYRKTMEVYLDSKWKKSRRNRFYCRLEDAQTNQREERIAALQKEKKEVQLSKEKQLEQLRYIRGKHQNRRERRLSTQHVKWKYVLGGVGGSDRGQYGLPSEYYTYYGFASAISNETKKMQVTLPTSNEVKSATKTRSTRGEVLQPSKQEISQQRRKNRERYDHLFRTRSTSQLDVVQKILQSGLYTVDVEEEIEAEGIRPQREEHSKPRPKLQKRTSTLVVKDVVNDAKRLLGALEESEPEASSTDNEE